MSLARRYNRTLRRHILHFAAWSPVNDPFAVGDFGLMRAGVFRKLGNIREFNVPFSTERGHPVAFDFSSTVSSTVRIQAGAQVPVFEGIDVDAALKLRFDGDFLTFVKAPEVDVEVMQASQAVALRLRNTPSWKRRFRVVWKVYTAKRAVIVASLDTSRAVEITGSAKALREFELGNAAVDVNVNSTHELKIVGDKGPVALDLFRVNPQGAVPLLGLQQAGPVVSDELEDAFDGSENWPSDADDPDDV